MKSDKSVLQLSSAWNGVAARWPLLVAGFALGSLLSLLFSVVFPARYQATAALAVNIDYGLTAPLDLIVEDRALHRANQLLMSDATLSAVLNELESSGGGEAEIDNVQALRREIRLDQRLARWELLAFSEDPHVAALIANTWASVALNRLDDAREHARIAAQLQGLPYFVECLALLPEPASPGVLWQCVASGPEIEPGIADEMRREIDASHGILPNLSFEIIEVAQAPANPILWGRGALILAGALLGLIAAAAISFVLGSRELKAGQTE